MRQVVFAYVSIYRWTFHPDINCFLNSSNEVLVLPPHNTEIFSAGFMTCDVVMVIYWGGGLRCSLYLSPKVLDDSPMYSSSQSTLLHSVDDATLFGYVVLIFGGHQEAFDGIASPKVCLYPMLFANILHAMTW